MRLGTVLFLVALLNAPSAVCSQTDADEHAVIQAAVRQTVDNTFPYVQKWVLSHRSERLPLGDVAAAEIDRARADYIARNRESLDLIALHPSEKVTTADLSRFEASRVFDWSAFEETFGSGTWTVETSRPGFAGPSNAVVRIDVWAREKRGPNTTIVFVTKQADGAWRATGGMSPVVRKVSTETAPN